MNDGRVDASSNLSVTRASERWYAVCCKPRQEAVAKENLLQQGYCTYLPCICNTRRRKEKWVSTVEPLFPRYLFIWVDPTQHSISPVRSTRGVSSLVRYSGMPAAVPEEVIEAIIRRTDTRSGLHRNDHPLFCAGEHIRLVKGPLVGMEGIFTEEDDEKRVVVLFELLGKANKTRAHRGCVISVAHI